MAQPRLIPIRRSCSRILVMSVRDLLFNIKIVFLAVVEVTILDHVINLVNLFRYLTDDQVTDFTFILATS